MKKFIFQVAALLLIGFGGMWYTLHGSSMPVLPGVFNSPFSGTPTPAPLTTNSVEIVSQDGKQVKAQLQIEIADTAQERVQGLSGRSSLPQDRGMLFVFDRPQVVKFWMKDMLIPLDFIWIRSNQIVDILPNVPAPSPGTADQDLSIYSPTVAVDRVLEVNAGFAQAHQLAIGDKIVAG